MDSENVELEMLEESFECYVNLIWPNEKRTRIKENKREK